MTIIFTICGGISIGLVFVALVSYWASRATLKVHELETGAVKLRLTVEAAIDAMERYRNAKTQFEKDIALEALTIQAQALRLYDTSEILE